MPAFSRILSSLSAERFAEILGASARKSRETYFHRHRIKSPKHSGLALASSRKTEARTKVLFELLSEREDEEMSQEILRNWLCAKRPMLVAALDHLKIAHNDGLTDSHEVEKIQKLNAAELTQLVLHLQTNNVAPVEDIAIYLKFMGAQKVDEAIAAC